MKNLNIELNAAALRAAANGTNSPVKLVSEERKKEAQMASLSRKISQKAYFLACEWLRNGLLETAEYDCCQSLDGWRHFAVAPPADSGYWLNNWIDVLSSELGEWVRPILEEKLKNFSAFGGGEPPKFGQNPDWAWGYNDITVYDRDKPELGEVLVFQLPTHPWEQAICSCFDIVE
jgi:hypothetical protein